MHTCFSVDLFFMESINPECSREIPRILDKELLKAESASARTNIDAVRGCIYSSFDDYINTAIWKTDRSFISMQVAKHFISVFERVNNALEADKSIDSSLSGTTAVSGICS